MKQPAKKFPHGKDKSSENSQHRDLSEKRIEKLHDSYIDIVNEATAHIPLDMNEHSELETQFIIDKMSEHKPKQTRVHADFPPCTLSMRYYASNLIQEKPFAVACDFYRVQKNAETHR
jgi:hypothetical protein